MEREIRLRVINPNTKKIIGYETWDIAFGWAFVILPDDTVRVGTFPDGVDRNIRNQWTGLRDKNGKEIYEGDIVRFHANYSSNPCGYMNGLVTFKHLQWMIRSGNHLYSIYEETDEFENKSEIIGNAYENPELIN